MISLRVYGEKFGFYAKNLGVREKVSLTHCINEEIFARQLISQQMMCQARPIKIGEPVCNSFLIIRPRNFCN